MIQTTKMSNENKCANCGSPLHHENNCESLQVYNDVNDSHCTCTPDQYSQCHKRCERVAVTEPKRSDFSYSMRGEHEYQKALVRYQVGADISPLQQQLNADADTIKRLMEDNEQLKQWKTEAMEVMAPMQEIGKAIGGKPGQSIHDKILPAIERLTLERDLAQSCNRKLVEALEIVVNWNDHWSLDRLKDIATEAINNNL